MMDYAFYNASALQSVTLSDSITSIGKYAFYSCSGLTSITIPGAETSIGDYAFRNCTQLTSLTLPVSASYTTYFSSSTYCPFDFTILTDLTITGEGDLTNYAFYKFTALKNVTLSDSITSIGSYAFYGCTGLTSITIPEAVTSIGRYSFYGCTSLTSVSIGDAVKSIGNYAFRSCSKLTSLTLPVSASYATYYSNSTYCPFDNAILTDLTLTGKGDIMSYAFYKATALKNVILSDNITSIGNSAFYGCTNLTSITIPDAVESIGESAFYGCSNLPSIYIPRNVTSMGLYAFYGCTGLQDVASASSTPPACSSSNSFSTETYGSAVLYVPQSAASDYACATAWEEFVNVCGSSDTDALTFEVDGLRYLITSVESMEVKLISGNYAGSIVVPETVDHNGNTYSVTAVGYKAFYNCTDLTDVVIGDSVSSIDEYAFSYCANLSSASIPDGITEVAPYTFYYCSGLTSITIPEAVTSIGNYAFRNCTGLTSITIPDAVTSIKNGAFYYCTGLTSLSIGKAVTSIGDSAFWKCRALTSLTFPDAATTIGDCAFSNCAGLTTVSFGDAATTIGDYAFSNCAGLTTVSFGDAATTIGDYAFSGCTGLTSITIPEAVTSIGNCAFSGCTSLRNLSLPASASFTTYYCSTSKCSFERTVITDLSITGEGDIMDYAFYQFTALQSLKISKNITDVGKYAFYGCKGLASITIPDAVDTIGDYAFYGCTGLAAVYSYNTTPPSCASSNCFSTSTYSDATLHVPSESLSDYASATAWENFINIASDLDTAVTRVTADAEEAQPTGYYSLSGQRLDTPAKNEVTIIRYSDGTAKKVFMK